MSLADFSDELSKTTKEYALSKKKIGAFDVSELERYNKSSTKIKNVSSSMNKKIYSSLDGLDKSIGKLDKDTLQLRDSFDDSASELTESLDELTSVTEENNTKMKYVSDGLKTLGKWTAMAAVPAAGYAAYRGIKGATVGTAKVAGRVATAPVRAGMNILDQPSQVAQETIGNVRGETKESFKKALGIGLMGTAGGIAPGMALKSLTRMFGSSEEGSSGGSGFGSSIKGMGATSIAGMSSGIATIANWVKGFPKKTQKEGIFHVAPEKNKEFQVAPDKEFTKGLESISEKVITTNELLDVKEGSGPLKVSPTDEFVDAFSSEDISNKKHRKLLANSISDAFQDTGKSGIFRSMIGDMFGLGATIGYAIPIFGAGYKAELSQPGKYGIFGAMLRTLGLLHVDSRFASHEINKIMLQQSKLLQIGFEIPGTLWRPRARSLSAWLGGTIAESFGAVVGGTDGPFAYLKDALTGKIKGLAGGVASFLGIGKDKEGGSFFEKIIPGYKEWGEKKKFQKEAEELKKSPSIATRIQLMSETKSLIEEYLPQINEGIKQVTELLKNGKLKTAKIRSAKIPKLAEAMDDPKEITEGGLVEVDKGETVGKIAKIKGTVKEKYSQAKEFVKDKTENIKGSFTNKKEQAEETTPKGGIFSRMLGGVANFFTGGIFKRIGKWFIDLKNAVVNLASDVSIKIKKVWDESIIAKKLTEFVDSFKEKFEYLKPIPELFKHIKGSFTTGTQFIKKDEKLKGDRTRTTFKEREKTSMVGGIVTAIQDFSKHVKKTFEDLAINISEILRQDLTDSPRSFSTILAKAFQDFVPDAISKGITRLYNKFSELIVEASTLIDKFTQPIRTALSTFETFGKKIIEPIKKTWEDEDSSLFTKALASIKAIPISIIEAFKGILDLAIGITKSIGQLGSAIFGAFMSLSSVGYQLAFEFGLTMVEVRKELVGKILPESWHKIYSKIEDWVLQVRLMSFSLIMSTINSIRSAFSEFTGSVDKEHGLIGIITSGFTGMFKAAKVGIKTALKPLTDLFVDITRGLKDFYKGLKEYRETGLFKNLNKDFSDLWKNIKETTILIKNNMIDFASFVSNTMRDKFKKAESEKVTTMATGGVIYAAKGVVVGEAGPEVVLPLDDPTATEKVAGMFSRALIKLGFKKDEQFSEYDNRIIEKLDTIIKIISSGYSKEGQSIFGKMLGGIADIGTGIIKLPLSMGTGFAKGISQGLGQLIGAPMTAANVILKTISKGIGLGVDIARATLSATRTGLTGIRHAINFGVSSLKTALSFGWKMITAPFKAVGRFIMKPFQSIKNKVSSVKEKIKDKVKGAFGFLKRKITGENVVGADPQGQPVTAKWPGKILYYLKGIYKILKGDSKINIERVAHESKMEYMTRKIRGGMDSVTGWLRRFWKKWILQGMLKIFGGLKTAFMFVGSQITTAITTLGSVLAARFGLKGLLGSMGGLGAAGAAAGVAGLGMAAYGAYKGVKKAGEWHGVKPGEKVKTSQKITAGIGGALGGSGEGDLKDAAMGAGKGALIGAGIGTIAGGPIGTAIGAGIGAIAGGILGAIGGKNISKALQYVFDGAKKTIKGIIDFITWPYKMIWKGIKKAKDWITEKIPSFDSIKDKLQDIIDIIMWPFEKIKELLTAAKDWITEKIKGIPFIGDWIGKKINNENAVDMKTGATEKVKGLFTPNAYKLLNGDVANNKKLMDIGAIVQGPKNTLGQKFYTKEESMMNDKNIPNMAKGGIVTAPTKALIGEAGPEAVIPLSGGLEQNPEILDAIKKQIIFHEGVRLSKYLDTLGKETIGIGHLIQPGERFPNKISKEEAYNLFDKDFIDHYQGIKERLNVFGNVDAVRQGALLDMAFNLGVSGVKKFKNALEYLKERNYEDAYKEIMYKSKDSTEKSLYAQQLPNRAKTVGGLILTGDEDNIVTKKPVITAHTGAAFMGDKEFSTVVKGGEMVVTPDEPKFGRVITDAFMNIISKDLKDRGSRYKEVENKAISTSSNIAEHEARMEVGKQKIIANELSQGNKNLKGSIDKLISATVINSTVNNATSNNSTTASSNVISNTGSSGFDSDTEKILGGRL